MKIDGLIAEMDRLLQGGVSEIPAYRALRILRGYFNKFDLPTYNIGRVKFDIDGTFFDDEEKADEAIRKFAMILKEIYVDLRAKGVAYSDDVFGDMLSSMAITLHENGEG